jgi:hypothetical protein
MKEKRQVKRHILIIFGLSILYTKDNARIKNIIISPKHTFRENIRAEKKLKFATSVEKSIR